MKPDVSLNTQMNSRVCLELKHLVTIDLFSYEKQIFKKSEARNNSKCSNEFSALPRIEVRCYNRSFTHMKIVNGWKQISPRIEARFISECSNEFSALPESKHDATIEVSLI